MNIAAHSINVLLVDDHAVLRAGMVSYLRTIAIVSIVDEAGTAKEAFKMLGEKHYDIVFMDISMPRMNGTDATLKIKAEYPHIKVIALSVHTDQQNIGAMLTAGADGYLFKEVYVWEVETAMVTVLNGGRYVTQQPVELIDEPVFNKSKEPPVELTERHIKIIAYLKSGCTSAEIGRKENISKSLVDS